MCDKTVQKIMKVIALNVRTVVTFKDGRSGLFGQGTEKPSLLAGKVLLIWVVVTSVFSF